MTQFKLMSRFAALAVASVLAIGALAGSALAQNQPDHTFYGNDAMPGDSIGVVGADGTELGSTTAADDGSWFVDVPAGSEEGATFTVNDEAAEGDVNSIGQGLTEVSNLTVAASEDSMGEDSMGEDSMGEDSMGEDSMGEDSMGEDSMGEDAMGDGEESMLNEDNDFPGTGSGGLAGNGGVSAGLIGLLIALAAVSVTGLGLRRMRNRA